MRATSEQRKQFYIEALGCLQAAKNLRISREHYVRTATAVHGWKGPLISGVEQNHWPESIKDMLRANAREIAQAVDDARKLWSKAGKKHATWLRLLPEYRVDGSRY